MSDTLRLEKHQHIGHIIINNPPANTWTNDSLKRLVVYVEALNADKKIRALVISGEGERFFSAGADLAIFARADVAQAKQMAGNFAKAFSALSCFKGVSIAAINGTAVGGGLEAALACDSRIASTHAKMGLPEATVGLLPCGGGTKRLAALVGEGWAKRMILCGELIDSATALNIGLVEQTLAPNEVLDCAFALAERVNQQSPSSVIQAKQLINDGQTMTLSQALNSEQERLLLLWQDGNRQEGCDAFFEKRPPNWHYG